MSRKAEPKSFRAANAHITTGDVNGILDKVDQAALIVSAEGDFIYANGAFMHLYNVDEKHAHDSKIYSPELGIITEKHFHELMDQTLANGGKLKYLHRMDVDGAEHWSEITIIEFISGEDERYLFLSKDVTELRQSQVKAEELNTMLERIIDNLPVYLFVKDVDDDLRYLIWNKAFAESSKIPAEKVIGRTDFEVFPEFRDAQAFREDDLNVIEKGEMQRKQETYMAADGRTRVVQTYKMLLHRQNRGPLLVGISLDITDIQGIEEELVKERLRAEESDRLKSRFLANISHEIRTPLNAIVGFANMIAEITDEDERQQFLNIINENTELLLQLINDILDLSKIEAGELAYIRIPMDFYKLCNNRYVAFKDRVDPGVQLVFDNANSPCRFIINEDPKRLMQVIDNLLGNAAKFTRRGEIHYGFIVKDDHIQAYVSDTGCGIPLAKQNEIFERFVKLDSFAQGSGLGLPICKQIVETLGGKMWVESQPDKGSTFYFTIPYRKYSGNPLEVKKQSHQNSEKYSEHHQTLERGTILVAEDNYSNFLVVKMLINGRHDIIWARDGQEAVELAREKSPDLILMDIKMPVMDGLEAARQILAFNPDVPIVALTANAFEEDRENARQAGMGSFLPKPVSRSAFEAIISAYL